MNPARILPLVGGLFSLSCVFEYRPDAPFDGSYELSKGCPLVVSPEKASASCTTEGTRVDVAIEEGKVRFNEVIVTEEVETNTECWVERRCSRTYSGTAERTKEAESGTVYDGRFALLAGVWAGKLVMKVSCTKEEAVASPPPWCTKKDKLEVTYTFGADVESHEASITWSGTDGTAGEFDALETKGGVRVADTFYPRLEEQPQTDAAASSSE